jgi:hypothetical protein
MKGTCKDLGGVCHGMGNSAPQILQKKQQASAFTEAFLRALSGRVLSPETTSQIVNTQ